MTAKYHVSVVVEKDEDGYFGYCPKLQGCYSQGETYEEIIDNMKDAVKLHIQDRLEDGDDVPHIDHLTITSLDVTV
jgi:predicted RNase H-like HicB family nuclease